jgi:hypothetical protein
MGAGVISHPNQFHHESGFCSTRLESTHYHPYAGGCFHDVRLWASTETRERWWMRGMWWQLQARCGLGKPSSIHEGLMIKRNNIKVNML